jgi:hypothetical protein
MLDSVKPPQDYLRGIPGYLSSGTLSQDNCEPDRTISWCTASELDRHKCERMSDVSSALGIRPLIKCQRETSEEICYRAVADGLQHIVVVTADMLAIATK